MDDKEAEYKGTYLYVDRAKTHTIREREREKERHCPVCVLRNLVLHFHHAPLTPWLVGSMHFCLELKC